ncbi:recombinase family protein [Clostridium fungisolvens]|uniref:recombinase family protein n=1 Tax=Clostridium fungisolvens TaxID=1604897 RepID=UPI003531267D
MTLKAAIYSRKSKFTGKGESIENQVQMCKDYASMHLSHKKIDEFLIYEDEGFSGGNTNRPEFRRLLEDARAKKFEVLICYRLDRISRNVADFSTTLETLQKYDIDFVSIREQFDTSSPMGRAMIYIASVFAQLERETIAERVRDNMLELAKTGRWLGGIAPLGYEADQVKYFDESMNERSMVKLKQVPEELKTVKLIFDKYLEFKALNKVETYLLQSNIKTKRGNNFSKNNLRIILSNTVYVKATKEVLDYLESLDITTCGEPDGVHGLLSYNKQKGVSNDNGKIVRVYRDTSDWIAAVSSHKGIIEASDWLQAQQILLQNKDRYITSPKAHNAILTGIIRCAICGSSMRISRGHTDKNGTNIYYYKCTLKYHSKGVRCNNKNVRVDQLDTVVKNSLKELGINKKSLIEKIKSKNKATRSQSDSPSKIYALENQIEEKKKQMNNLVTKLSMDNDIEDILVSKIKSLKTEISSLHTELEKQKNLNSEFDEEEVNLSFLEMLLDRCSLIDTLSNDEVKELVKGLVEKITWNGTTQDFVVDFVGSEEDKKK